MPSTIRGRVGGQTPRRQGAPTGPPECQQLLARHTTSRSSHPNPCAAVRLHLGRTSSNRRSPGARRSRSSGSGRQAVVLCDPSVARRDISGRRLRLSNPVVPVWYRLHRPMRLSVPLMGDGGTPGRGGTHCRRAHAGWGPKSRWFKSSRPDFRKPPQKRRFLRFLNPVAERLRGIRRGSTATGRWAHKRTASRAKSHRDEHPPRRAPGCGPGGRGFESRRSPSRKRCNLGWLCLTLVQVRLRRATNYSLRRETPELNVGLDLRAVPAGGSLDSVVTAAPTPPCLAPRRVVRTAEPSSCPRGILGPFGAAGATRDVLPWRLRLPARARPLRG